MTKKSYLFLNGNSMSLKWQFQNNSFATKGKKVVKDPISLKFNILNWYNAKNTAS